MDTYKPLPRLPAFEQYDSCLSMVKQQIDIMSRHHPLATLQWLSEVQTLLNRARDNLLALQVNDERQFYTDGFADE